MTPPEPEYRTIPLTQGQVTKVSASAYTKLSLFSWCASRQKEGRYVAVRRQSKEPDGYIYMHRQIMDLEYGDSRQVDHINGDSLDNRQENLRIATMSQNGMNRTKQRNNSSGYKGVSWNSKNRKWIAQIVASGKYYYLGCFGTAELAYEAYCFAAARLHERFARTR